MRDQTRRHILNNMNLARHPVAQMRAFEARRATAIPGVELIQPGGGIRCCLPPSAVPTLTGFPRHEYRYAWAERAKVCGYPQLAGGGDASRAFILRGVLRLRAQQGLRERIDFPTVLFFTLD